MSEIYEQRNEPAARPMPGYRPGGVRASEPINLADLLERVLDKGIVIAGDVQLYLGGIELLTLKIRLLIASVDKAQEIGINWWESDPALSSQNRELRKQRDELSRRLDRIEAHTPGLESDGEYPWEWEPALSAQNRELRKQRDELQERLDKLEAMIPDLQEQAAESEEKQPQTRRRRKRE